MPTQDHVAWREEMIDDEETISGNSPAPVAGMIFDNYEMQALNVVARLGNFRHYDLKEWLTELSKYFVHEHGLKNYSFPIPRWTHDDVVYEELLANLDKLFYDSADTERRKSMSFQERELEDQVHRSKYIPWGRTKHMLAMKVVSSMKSFDADRSGTT